MLLSLLRISMRNVTRNFRRSLITATAVLVGTSFIIIARGVLNGFHASIVNSFTETQAGDLQLHRPDYLEANEALPLDRTFALNDRFKSLMDSQGEVTAYTGRVMFTGMISNGDDTTLFVGMGIDPEQEYKVCPGNQSKILAGGGPVTAAEEHGIVVGKALAESLHAQVGSDLTLLVNTKFGSLNGMDFKVVGIADYSLPGIGNKIVHLPLKTAQKLLALDDQITEVAVNVRHLEEVGPLNSRLKAQLTGEYKDLNLTPNTWMDVGQVYVNAIELQNSVLRYIIAVFFIVMIAGIVNTMLMSVFERIREVGTMMAIGVRRKRILAMFLFEAMTLGSMGALAGLIFGGGFVLLTGRVGFPMPSIGDAEAYTVYPYVAPSYMLTVMGIALVTAVIAALYPALRASRLRPAEALRTM